MGPRIREDNGRGRLFVGNVGGDHPHPPSSRGQALTFPPGGQGGRDLLARYYNEILRLRCAALGMTFGWRRGMGPRIGMIFGWTRVGEGPAGGQRREWV